MMTFIYFKMCVGPSFILSAINIMTTGLFCFWGQWGKLFFFPYTFNLTIFVSVSLLNIDYFFCLFSL